MTEQSLAHTCWVGLHLPHRVDPEVSEEGVVRGMSRGVERDLAAIVGDEED